MPPHLFSILRLPVRRNPSGALTLVPTAHARHLGPAEPLRPPRRRQRPIADARSRPEPPLHHHHRRTNPHHRHRLPQTPSPLGPPTRARQARDPHLRHLASGDALPLQIPRGLRAIHGNETATPIPDPALGVLDANGRAETFHVRHAGRGDLAVKLQELPGGQDLRAARRRRHQQKGQQEGLRGAVQDPDHGVSCAGLASASLVQQRAVAGAVDSLQ